MKLKKHTFKYLENELMTFPDTLKEVNLLRQEILHNKNNEDENIGGGKNNLPSDPTGTTATRLATHKKLLYLEKITYVIQNMYDSLPKLYQDFIMLKYWGGKFSDPSVTMVGEQLAINRDKAYKMREEIISYLALELGYR